MNLPKPLIGAGIGAVTGGLGAAATGSSDQTISQRVGRGILGGMAGSAIGGAGHMGLRYRGLRKMNYTPASSLDEAVLGTRSISGMKKSLRDTKKAQEAAAAADDAAKVVQEKVKESFGFSGSPQEIKKQYRTLARKHHPDRGGNQEIFDQLNASYREAMERAKSAATAQAQSSATAQAQNRPPRLLTTTKTSSVSPEEIVKLASFYHELGLLAKSEDEVMYAIDCLNRLAR